ncbi:diacylglycerol kinase [Legionella sp. km535]|uniref:diacylglycerol kinase n=1 Tax=Legionella sp. km535 TaxID=2498107 RepID=UPI000F8DB002|nr:diacylglycerol kinase [Legionella sp. km535]RUR20580.1 diacylglycerol kinase [Legionella sp. km535]
MVQGILHFYNAFKNSWNGLKYAFRYEWAFKFELVLLACAIPCAFVLGNNAVELILLIGSVVLLLIVELLNSAIETTVDRISLEHHPLSGLAKDLASAAIFVVGINAAVTWGVFLVYALL